VPISANIYRQSDFGGGLNSRSAEHLIHSTEAVALQNATLSAKRGLLRRRNGYTKYNSSQIDSNPIHGLYRYYKNDGSAYLLTSSGTKIYLASATTLDATTLASGLTSNLNWQFTTLEDICLAGNGTNLTQRFDGTTMRRAGFAAPTSSVSLATGSAGALTGVYQYGVTFVYDDDAEESSLSPTSSLTLSAQKCELTSIPRGQDNPTLNPGVTKRNIYRTEAGGSRFYYLATIENDTATVYTDNAADTALDTDDEAPNDNGIPPRAKYIQSFANRVWYANVLDGLTGGSPTPSRVYFSALVASETSPNATGTAPIHGAGPEIVPSDFWIDIEADDGDVITGLSVTLDSLIVFKEKSIWRIIGDNPSNFEVQRADADIGCVAPRSIVKVETLIYFLTGGDKPSVAATDGIRVVPIGERVQPTLEADIDKTAISTACAARYRYNYVLIYKSSTGTENDNGLVYDYIKGAWATVTNIPANVFSVWDGSSDTGQCFFGSALAGDVFQYDTGTSDNGSDITSVWQSKFYDFGKPEIKKWIKRLLVMSKKDGDDITIDILRDFNTSAVASETVTTTNAAEPTDGGVAPSALHPADTCKGRYFSIKLTSAGTGDFDVYGFALYFDEHPDGT